MCRKPNPDLRHHLINIMYKFKSLIRYSICVASRSLNGDIIELNLEFYEIMIQICYSLSN